jgi:Domain of unknown function DUF1828/Domain of unknown function DUF1829
MSAQAAQDLSAEYLNWLKNNLIAFERGSDQVLSTPFLDPFNDGIEVSLDTTGGEMLLHDGGKTLENLLDMGVQIEKSERRQAIIQHAIAGCGVRLNNGRLETVVSQANRAQRMHFLTTAILRLNDLWMTANPRTVTDFFEIVKEYFDEHDVLYTANKSITGRTVEHPIDFIIPLPKGRDRLIKLISRPSVQAAKIASFTWVDLQESQPTAERIVFVNDFVRIEDSEDITPDVKSKAINESVTAILKGYSTKIFPWSEASNDQEFALRISR